jgi:hypothetical protein
LPTNTFSESALPEAFGIKTPGTCSTGYNHEEKRERESERERERKRE